MLLPEDEFGYAVPYADHDALIECELCDPLAGPPESWPQCPWVDGDYYELGPEPFAPSDSDWAEYCDMMDRIDTERVLGINARFA